MINLGIFHLRLKCIQGSIGTAITNATTIANTAALDPNFYGWAQFLLDNS